MKSFKENLPTKMTDEEFEELLQQIGFEEEETQIIVEKTSVNKPKADKEYFKTLADRINELAEENKSTNAKEVLDCQSLLLVELQNRYAEQLMNHYKSGSKDELQQEDEERLQ